MSTERMSGIWRQSAKSDPTLYTERVAVIYPRAAQAAARTSLPCAFKGRQDACRGIEWPSDMHCSPKKSEGLTATFRQAHAVMATRGNHAGEEATLNE